MATAETVAFGDLLRRFRKAAGLTQEELAERAGLSRRGINDLERGVRRRPRRDTVALLATALGLLEAERISFEAAARGSAERQTTAQGESSPLPTGTVTFLFTDIEGSTRLLQRLGAARYADALETMRRLLRAACAQHQGHEVDATGDSSFFAFAQAPEAAAAAAQTQRDIAAHTWPEGATVLLRMGLHTGTAQLAGDHYVGLDVHRAARIAEAGHGGQMLLSEAIQALVVHDLPAGARLRDLGAHRLKDLQHPERLFQLVLAGLLDLPTDFPPLNALDRHPHNLPIQPTPLLGREQEVAEVVALLCRDDVRLVTLTGPGGVGKTRLGLQVAAELVDTFADGVWFVGLSRLTDPELVVPTIARTLGLQEVGGRPLEELLREHLRARQLLLLLDNCEQVAQAAPAVADLFQTSPQLTVLATSRVVLHLQGEHEYPVPPLALPPTSPTPRRLTAEQLLEAPAVALFVERARAHRPDFALTESTAPTVASICAQLDGLPLALGLAAARVKVLPPAQLLARLERRLPLLTDGPRDLEVRQQTMHNTLAWSEDLLSPQEQRLFRRLAVFVGGFTLEAAEAICAAPAGVEPLAVDMLNGLGALVDQNLVQQREESGKARFSLLQVVREYALERLDEYGEEAEALRRVHATYYLRLAEEAEQGLLGSQVRTWLQRLARELDNLRAALAWAHDQRELELGLRASRTLVEFHVEAGDMREAWHWLQAFLALALPEGLSQDGVAAAIRGGLPAPVLAKALDDAGAVAGLTGAVGEAERLQEHSLALCRSLGDRAGEGQALFDLGIAASRQGDLARAVALYEASLELLRGAGGPWWVTFALACLADQLSRRGEFDRAEALLEEALPLARALDNPIRLSLVLINLGDVAREQGDWSRSLALEREALVLARDVGKNHYVALALAGIGLALSAQGLSEPAASTQQRAMRLLAAAMGHCERIGLPEHSITDSHTFERAVMARHAMLGDARSSAAWEAAWTLPLEEAVAEALGTEQGMSDENHGGMS